ncbi:hypothetical protein EVAR_360_1 [Eumeta japonica]|uniref:Uncharacterized protein n=1 Tax=Eumeta variegata TaxID=151549 RepID=A0A4C1SA03_EUMVA|nr:hypothetical protein EVAR_360_1 [Eumeta japonica]
MRGFLPPTPSSKESFSSLKTGNTFVTSLEFVCPWVTVTICSLVASMFVSLTKTRLPHRRPAPRNTYLITNSASRPACRVIVNVNIYLVIGAMVVVTKPDWAALCRDQLELGE